MKTPAEVEDEALAMMPDRKGKNPACFADKTCWNCGEVRHINRYCTKPKKVKEHTASRAEAVSCACAKECNSAFGVECASDGNVTLDMASVSDSSISEDSDPDKSVPHSDSTPDTSVGEIFGSMPDLESVSDSSAQDNSMEDGMEVESDPDLTHDLADEVPELEDDINWSAVRAFQRLTLEDEAAFLDDEGANCPRPRVELLDSGCTCHISLYKDDFTVLKDILPRPFQAANKQHFSVTGQGELVVEVPNGANMTNLQLHEVLYLPKVGYTLISVGKLDDLGFNI
jgi:hypothetical protein